MNKGTLTLLPDYKYILGLPLDRDFDLDETERIKGQVVKWLKEGTVLVVPFPIEVTDLRKHE